MGVTWFGFFLYFLCILSVSFNIKYGWGKPNQLVQSICTIVLPAKTSAQRQSSHGKPPASGRLLYIFQFLVEKIMHIACKSSNHLRICFPLRQLRPFHQNGMKNRQIVKKQEDYVKTRIGWKKDAEKDRAHAEYLVHELQRSQHSSDRINLVRKIITKLPNYLPMMRENDLLGNYGNGTIQQL